MYEVSEFITMLRLGLWTGGDISGVGRSSAARAVESGALEAGVWGMDMGRGVMLEHLEEGEQGQDALLSVYNPYDGGYACYRMTVYTGRDKTAEALAGKTRANFTLDAHPFNKANPGYSVMDPAPFRVIKR
jgi:hypothetical protein